MKKRRLLTVLLCFVFCFTALVGCATAEKGVYVTPSYDYESDSNILYSKKLASSDEIYETQESAVTEDRKIIRTVSETLDTDRFDDFMASLDDAVTFAGGYFGTYRVSGEESDRCASLTIYIPAEKLDDFTAKVGDLGAVTSYEESANDVTEAYVDVESRITVLEAEESSLLTMLSEAKTITDMLAVREQLSDVQQDLASLCAQKTSYDKRISYSTVNMYVYEVDYASETGEKPFFRDVADTFVESLDGVLSFLRGVGVVLLGGFPIILLVGGIGCGVFFIIRGLHRKQEKRRLAKKQENKNE